MQPGQICPQKEARAHRKTDCSPIGTKYYRLRSLDRRRVESLSLEPTLLRRQVSRPATDVLSCLAMTSEEHAVVFRAELREIRVRSCWIRFEVEAVPGLPRRRGRDRNRRGTLEEVATELVRRIAESGHAAGDAAPLDSHRVDYGAKNPEGVRRIETVGNRENVEDRADIMHQQLRRPSSKVHLPAADGIRSAPKDERASHNPWVIGVEAQRAAMGGRSAHPQTVQSYEANGTAVPLIVEPDEDTVHKAHVAVEVVNCALAAIEVRAFARENQIGLGDHAGEVGDDRRVVAGVRAGCRVRINRTGEKKVDSWRRC